MMNYELGIIGAGNMAEAIARGVIDGSVLQPSQIIAADPLAARQELFTNQLGVRATDDAVEAARRSKRILLAVKPQQMQAVLADLAGVMDASALVISIAAGVASGSIAAGLGGGGSWRIVRVMPNTPMLLGRGMAVLAAGANATADDLAWTRRLFAPAAAVLELPESAMDAVTAMSGSGPAYFFYLAEQMIAAGIEMGLTAEQAKLLTIKTAVGAAAMLESGGAEPAELRRRVTSPGGTTQAAIEIMVSRDLPRTVIDALKAAAARAGELSRELAR